MRFENSLLLMLCATLTWWPGQAWADRPDARQLHFSARPTDAELSSARVFDEPLIPLDGESRADENQALAAALARYANRSAPDDCSSLGGFAEAFPNSRWTGPLLVHLGTEYCNYGYYSKALTTWERAWALCRDVRSGLAKPEADRAAGELARMYSKLGRVSELSGLLDSVKERDLAGPASQLIGAARDALWMMQHKPDFCFKCGPLALERIRSRQNPNQAGERVIGEARSGTNGFCLRDVEELSRRVGMNYQVAFRAPGAPFILPAVVHWKAGHYAALVQRDGDRVLAQDYTFQTSVWMTTNALEEEASGYFLVPSGELPAGWRVVAGGEARNVWGKGFVGGKAPGATTKYDTVVADAGNNPCPPEVRAGLPPRPAPPPPTYAIGMAVYSLHAMLVSLTLKDTPVGYAPPVGPLVYFTASYHQQEANQPATFSYSNLGAKWTCNWVSYITDNPTSPNADVTLYVDGGGTLNFTGFNPATQSYLPEVMSQSQLVKLSASSYELRFPGGDKREFELSDGSAGSSRRVFLTQVIDPAGNAVRLNYDVQLRITNIVDAIGQATTLLYTNTAYPSAITAVADPFGRTAYLRYDTNGLLTQITDVLGLTSQITYGANQFITALTTPYGTTTFATGQTNGVTFLQTTDPLGASELLEYTQNPVVPHSLPASQVPHGLSTFNLFIDARNSFFWDKKAFADGAGDYTKAKLFHWLHHTPISTDASPLLESEKEPLESRVWYNYAGQSTNFGSPYYLDAAYSGATAKPSVVARILDDGTTQLAFYRYNALGNLTNSIDPVGRTFSYVYDSNNVDLLEVRMTHGGKNELLRRWTYNSQHRPLTATDAAEQTSTNTYNSRGQLLSASDALGQTTTFSYATNGYLLSITGPWQNSNDVTRFTYDSFGRIQTITDTEGYTTTYAYDVLDRVAQVTYPDGTYEQFVFNLFDLAARRDRLGRWTTNTYNALRQLVRTQDPLGRTTQYEWCQCGALASLTDPMGRTTSWRYDVQSRPVAQVYADGSTVLYAYESATSRLRSKRDEKGQETFYEYYPDGLLRRVSYPNAIIPTPGVSYTYDSDYVRIVSMQDGSGTTTYAYDPINLVPAPGAGQLASISGPFPNSTVTYQYDRLQRVANRSINAAGQAFGYDNLGRIISVTNALGAFHYDYAGATPRLAAEAYPNGQTNLYAYFDNLGDQRLRQIQHLKPDGSQLSQLTYAYNPAGQITSWSNQLDAAISRLWTFGYDAVDQLTNAVLSDGVTTLNSFSYAYDPAGNRVQQQVSGVTQQFSYNALNQLTSSSAGATNGATYEWDGANRLSAINQGTHRSEFSYDGLGRRVRLVEKTNGVVASDHRFLWCSTELCEERDASGAVVLRRFFPQGESVLGGATVTNYFYTRDHLGTVREAVDSTGSLATRYDYDPYGRQTVVQENFKTAFAFTGHFVHAASGLYLTLHRPLDSTTGRWLSRDPGGHGGGLNLYAYVGNNPVNLFDRYGLRPCVDRYSSADEAGLQALQDINDQSIREDTEYAGRIYRNGDGTYSYTPPRRGTLAGSSPGPVPPGTQNAGDYHTHGGPDPGYDNEHFSRTDKQGNAKEGTPGYLGTPAGSFYKYDPGRDYVSPIVPRPASA